MNWGALAKHVLSGFLSGFLAIAAVNGVDSSLNLDVLEMAALSGGIGALRALQEWVSPTSYLREPRSGVEETLAGGKK